MRIGLVIFFIVVIVTSAASQISFGVKGGLNLNYMLYKYELNGSISESPDKNSNVGFHLGGYVQIPLSAKFNFQPELLFTRRGTGDINLNYFELPLLLSYVPFRAIQFELGANVGFLLSSSRPFFSDYKNNFDVGLAGGLRYLLPKGFFINVRYYYGLSAAHSVDLYNIYKFLDPNDPLLQQQQTITLDTYNRNIQFSIGYKIK